MGNSDNKVHQNINAAEPELNMKVIDEGKGQAMSFLFNVRSFYHVNGCNDANNENANISD